MTPVKGNRAREPDEKYIARTKFAYPKAEEKMNPIHSQPPSKKKNVSTASLPRPKAAVPLFDQFKCITNDAHVGARSEGAHPNTLCAEETQRIINRVD
jgi:hypothetical protein